MGPMGAATTPPGTTPGTPPGTTPMGQPTPTGQPPYPAVPSRPARALFYIASDEVTNTILVTGPPEIIAKAKDIVENRLDKPNPDVKNPQPILTGPPSFENISLRSGNADAFAKDLQAIFPATSTLRISSNGPNALRVFACPKDMDRIKGYIQQYDGKGARGDWSMWKVWIRRTPRPRCKTSSATPPRAAGRTSRRCPNRTASSSTGPPSRYSRSRISLRS